VLVTLAKIARGRADDNPANRTWLETGTKELSLLHLSRVADGVHCIMPASNVQATVAVFVPAIRALDLRSLLFRGMRDPMLD
jgi:hypothetical protein